MRLVVRLVVVALIAGSSSATAHPATPAPMCDPEVLLLPTLEGHQSSALDAMNSRGWAVGSSRAHRRDPQQLRYRVAVMWRDGAVLDLGFERDFTRDRKVESNAVDVNESGLVAVVQNRYEDATWVEASSWLWDNGTKTRLAVGGASAVRGGVRAE